MMVLREVRAVAAGKATQHPTLIDLVRDATKVE
jgi:hypothetical protein